jgi:hypothetical protein
VEAMPSRKKAKGQARKAAQAEKNEAEKVKQEEEQYRELEQSQIQRLQVNNQHSVLPLCMHGFVPFSNDDICIKFIRAFVREFYKCLRKIYKAERQAERAIIVSLLQTRESTQDEYSEVWNNAAKMKQMIKYFLYNGTMFILDCESKHPARHSAILARFFEQMLKVKVHKCQAFIDWLKVLQSADCDERTVLKFFWRRIRCSCLDKVYEEAKSIPKTGLCLNQQCRNKRLVERSKLRCCSRCRSVSYCSRECQAEDWSIHESFCDEVVAVKAEYDASQQQQS